MIAIFSSFSSYFFSLQSQAAICVFQMQQRVVRPRSGRRRRRGRNEGIVRGAASLSFHLFLFSEMCGRVSEERVLVSTERNVLETDSLIP